MTTYYLGFQRLDIYTSLALDDVIKKHAVSGDTYVRIFQISPPSVNIASREDLSDVNLSAIENRGYNLTRRPTPGSAILCNDQVLCVSVALPYGSIDKANGVAVHRDYSKRISRALMELGIPELYVCNWFSIRTSNKTHIPNVIAGFSVRMDGRSTLYHGVIMKDRIDPDILKEMIKFRKIDGVDEFEYVRNLPVITDFVRVDDDELNKRVLERLTEGSYEMIPQDRYDELMGEARDLAERKYKNSLWISEGRTDGERKPVLERNLGYCLADLFYPESMVYAV